MNASTLRLRVTPALAAVLMFTVASSTGRATATFHGIGDLPGGPTYSIVWSATKVDGTIYAVGGSATLVGQNGPDTAVIWSSATGQLTAIPNAFVSTLPGPGVQASAITPDGRYIAARTRTAAGAFQAVRVTRDSLATLNLGSLPDVPAMSAALGLSDDGEVLYGFSRYNPSGSPGMNQAVRFTASGPSLNALPLPAPFNTSTVAVHGVSANGAVAVGTVRDTVTDGADGVNGFGPGNRGFRYVASINQITGLPLLPAGTWNGALGLSPDASRALLRGNSLTSPQGEIYFQTAGLGISRRLYSPNGSRRAGDLGSATADGTVVTALFTPADNPAFEAYIHNQYGWHPLAAVLGGAGLDLTAWSSLQATGISRDGTLLWGVGRRNGASEGWVAEFAPGYLGNFDQPPVPPQSSGLSGLWYVDNLPTASGGTLLAFLPNGSFYLLETTSEADDGEGGGGRGADGFERGTYNWNADTGALTLSLRLDTTGDMGTSEFDGQPGLTLALEGDTATVSNEGGAFTFHRLRGEAGTPVGGWAFVDAEHPDRTSVLALLPNGVYYLASGGAASSFPQEMPGIEIGTYTWDANSGAFSATPTLDLNGEHGLSHLNDPAFLSLSPDRLLLTISDESGPSTLTLIVDPAEVTPTITSALYASGTYGAAFNYTIAATQNPSVFAADGLPAGLAVETDTGAIDGIPSETGTFSVAIAAGNSLATGSALLEVEIGKAAATVQLGGLLQVYDGQPKTVTTTTLPASLAVSVTYDGESAPPSAEGTYAVEATVDDANYAGSTTGTLQIARPVVISTQPASQQVIEGNPVTFTVVASGTGPLAYQWRRGTNLLPNTNSATLFLAAVQSGDAGTYRVDVSNVLGSTTSTPATLTVIVAPAIVQAPQSVTVVAGQDVTLAVTATGTPLAYQWRKDGIALPGETSSSLRLRNVTSTAAGAYSVSVSNAAGTVTSADAIVTVLVPPQIATQPASVTAAPGQTVSFSVVATGTAPLTYQWYFGKNPIAGAQSDTLVLAQVQSADAGNYSVVVSNAAGSIASKSASLKLSRK